MARTQTFADKFAIVDALVALQTDDKSVSRFLKLQLVQRGFLEATKAPELKKPGRGRTPIVYNFTGKAKSYISLSKNWKRAA